MKEESRHHRFDGKERQRTDERMASLSSLGRGERWRVIHCENFEHFALELIRCGKVVIEAVRLGAYAFSPPQSQKVPS